MLLEEIWHVQKPVPLLHERPFELGRVGCTPWHFLQPPQAWPCKHGVSVYHVEEAGLSQESLACLWDSLGSFQLPTRWCRGNGTALERFQASPRLGWTKSGCSCTWRQACWQTRWPNGLPSRCLGSSRVAEAFRGNGLHGVI